MSDSNQAALILYVMVLTLDTCSMLFEHVLNISTIRKISTEQALIIQTSLYSSYEHPGLYVWT